MAQYHINSKGEPGRCSVTTGTCPFGKLTDHFQTPEDARAAYEKGQVTLPAANKKGPQGPTYPHLYAFVESDEHPLDPKTSRQGDSIFTQSGRLYRVARIDRREGFHSIRLVELNPETGESMNHVPRLLSHFGDDFTTAKTVANYRVGEEKTEAAIQEKLNAQLREEEKFYLERDRAENVVNGIVEKAPEAFEELEELRKGAKREEKAAHSEEYYRRQDIQARYFSELKRIQRLDRDIELSSQQRAIYENEIAKIHDANKRELRVLNFTPKPEPFEPQLPKLAPRVQVRKNPPSRPNHSMVGRILNVVPGGFEVKWENNTITYESAKDIEPH